MAIVHPGKLVILDEPANDVDPIRRKLLWNEVRLLAENSVAVLLITHNVLEAEQSVDRLAIMHNGNFIRTGTLMELKQLNQDYMYIELQQTQELTNPLPKELTIISKQPHRLLASFAAKDQEQVIDWIVSAQNEREVDEITLQSGTLEEAYAFIVQQKQTHRGSE